MPPVYKLKKYGGVSKGKGKQRAYQQTQITKWIKRNRPVLAEMAAQGIEAGVAGMSGSRALGALAGRGARYLTTSTQTATRPRKSFSGHSVGIYKGRFRRGRKSAGKFVKQDTKFASMGMLRNLECYGTTTDADCVYVGHSTYAPFDIAEVIAAAVLRKLLKKVGFNPESYTQEIPIRSTTDARGMRLTWTIVTQNSTTNVENYDFVDNDTLFSVTIAAASGGVSFKDRIQQFMDGTWTNGERIQSVALYYVDAGTTTNYLLAAELNMDRERLQVYVRSELTIQNRTKGATATGEDSDRVDSQPLKGMSYLLAGGVPKTIDQAYNQLNRTWTVAGVILSKAANLPGAYKEPPLPKTFTNCKKSRKQSLQPGDIRKSVLVHNYAGMFNTMICQKLKSEDTIVTGTPNRRYTGYAPGKSEVFAFEEILNTGSTNLITVAYECDKKLGACLTTMKAPIMKPDYAETSFSI